MTSFWCLYCELWTDSAHCSSVYIVDFEQVNAGLAVNPSLANALVYFDASNQRLKNIEINDDIDTMG